MVVVMLGDDIAADLKRPVYRHLLEQRWRNYGTLDLLVRSSGSVSSPAASTARHARLLLLFN